MTTYKLLTQSIHNVSSDVFRNLAIISSEITILLKYKCLTNEECADLQDKIRYKKDEEMGWVGSEGIKEYTVKVEARRIF